MRIVHVTPSMARSNGGVSTALRGLALAQAETDYVRVYTGWAIDDGEESPPVFDEPVDREGLQVLQYPLSRNPISRRFESSPRLAKALARDISTFDIAHIHSMWNWCVRDAAQVCRNLGKPYVLSVHGGLDPWLLRTKATARGVYFRLIERSRLEKAAAVHFTSETEARLADSLGLSIRPVVVPLGVEEVFLQTELSQQDARRRFDLPQDAFVIAQIGRVDPVKAVDILLRAWAVGRESGDILWVVGPGSPARLRALQALAAKIGVEDGLRFDDPVYGDERVAAYRAADLVTLCSHKENFGLAAAEAMACAVPVLVGAGVNTSSDVAAAGAGWVTRTDEVAIAESISKIRSVSPAKRRQMGQAGRRWASEHYRWRRVAGRMSMIYSEVLTERP